MRRSLLLDKIILITIGGDGMINAYDICLNKLLSYIKSSYSNDILSLEKISNTKFIIGGVGCFYEIFEFKNNNFDQIYALKGS